MANNRRRGSHFESGPREGGNREALRMQEAYISYPRTNHELAHNHSFLNEAVENRIGMVASSIEISPKKVRIIIEPGHTPIRENDKVPAAHLPVKEELQFQDISVEHQGDTRILSGEFGVEIETVPIIGDKAVVFEGGRGGGHIHELMQTMPAEQLSHSVAENYLILARDKGSKETRMVVPKTGDSSESRLAVHAKERVLQSLTPQLSGALSGSKVRPGQIMTTVSEVECARTVQPVHPDKMTKEFDEFAKDIEVVFGERVEKFKGFIQYDKDSKTLTLARPLRIDAKKNKIDPSAIQVHDATGRGRRPRWITSREAGQNSLLSSMLSGVETHKKVAQTFTQLTKEQQNLRLLRSSYGVPVIS